MIHCIYTHLGWWGRFWTFEWRRWIWGIWQGANS